MSKSQLATAAGHSAPYITQVEAGDRPSPSMDAIEKWCNALKIDDPRALFLEPNVDELVQTLGSARKREEAEREEKNEQLRKAIA